jgi:hypothetical protein
MALKEKSAAKAATKDNRLKWSQTPHVEAGLERIEKLGIYGRDLSQIVNHIIGEELRRLLESGLLTRDELREAVESLAKAKALTAETEEQDS